MHLWHKRVSPAQADHWIGCLQPVVDPARLAVVTPAAGRSVRLEVYCDAHREADALAKRFGGQVRVVRDERWQPAPATTRGHPLSIGGGLLVTGHPDELAALRAARSDRRVLCIPAAMAFGTGEHATTAMCLRFLTQIARRRRTENWEMLDLGMGSGILALAGSVFGAGHAFGLDNDAHAVRTARENARLNGINARQVRFARADLSMWRPDVRTWPGVMANLFSELLVRLMPEVIAPAVASGGDLVLSGVLVSQADEVVASVRKAGFTLLTVKRRGRWRAFHGQRD